MKRTEYDDALRERAVRSVAAGVSIKQVAQDLGITTSTDLYDWLRRAGLKPPYGPGFVKALPAGTLFGEQPLPRPTPTKSRRLFSEDYKTQAVRAFAAAVADGTRYPIQEVARAAEVSEGRLRNWAYKLGFGSEGSGLDYDKLKKWGGKTKTPPVLAETGASVPALHTPQTSKLREQPQEQDRGEVMTPQLEWALGEIKRLEGEVLTMKREREVFISASTILGRERAG